MDHHWSVDARRSLICAFWLMSRTPISCAKLITRAYVTLSSFLATRSCKQTQGSASTQSCNGNFRLPSCDFKAFCARYAHAMSCSIWSWACIKSGQKSFQNRKIMILLVVKWWIDTAGYASIWDSLLLRSRPVLFLVPRSFLLRFFLSLICFLDLLTASWSPCCRLTRDLTASQWNN